MKNETHSRSERDERVRSLLHAAHAHASDVILDALDVNVQLGLSSELAAQKLLRDGANTLQRTVGYSLTQILVDQFSSVIVWLLGGAAIVAWFAGDLIEALAILVVLFINAAIGFLIELRAGRALEALRRETQMDARVRRDGKEKVIDSSELVVGDLVVLAAGDRVPADARLLEAVNLSVDESTLTGESIPVEKCITPVDRASILAERNSMLHLGTLLVGGRALAIVTATATRTELGRIGQLISKTEEEKTPLEKRLSELGARLVYIVIAIAVIVSLIGVIRGDEFWLMIKVGVSLAVAAVPEGLPAVTTLILALGVLRMARRKAIVRRLAAVESLGSVTVICSDKTGTLTENRMTVREYQLSSGTLINLDQNADSKSEQFPKSGLEGENLSALLRVSILCNDAAFDSGAASDKIAGDPTETSLLIAAHQLGSDIGLERKQARKIYEQPFDSSTRRMIAAFSDERGGFYSTMKGAPNIVLNSSAYFLDSNGERKLLDANSRAMFLEKNEAMANRALRVLAFAHKPLKDCDIENPDDATLNELESGYTFLGFAAMSDPPRAGVAEAIRAAHRAGIRVVMLTGDQLSTARAIARELDLKKGDEIFAFHARDIIEGDDEHLSMLAKKADVFARVSPENKLRIVEALQLSGEIVAVTGDGINDAPALKRADIGIAMGMRGTEVAKEAADVVLADDNFSTIVEAIEGGRTIYANIIKFVNLMFAENLAEVLFIFSALIFGLALPLLPLQILWVNIVTDIFPALALAVEPPTPDTMTRRPRAVNEAILSKQFLFLISWQAILLAAITLAAYWWALNQYGEGSHARTVALFALIATQVGHLFNCRSRTRSAFSRMFANPFVFVAVAIVVALQILVLSFASLSRLLDVTPVNIYDIVVIALCVVAPIVAVEIVKSFQRRAELF